MKKLTSIVVISLILFSCVQENKGDVAIKTDDFNRELVLTNWVNNLAIPAYDDLNIKIADLKTKSDNFIANPNTSTQEELQLALFQAQKVWQHVAMFELQGATRIFVNTYPVDSETSTQPFPNSNEDDATLETNLENLTTTEIENLDFSLSGKIDEQGFAVVDYLINQNGALEKFTTGTKIENYKTYLNKVVATLVLNINNAATYWKTNANEIIANNGSNANASFDKMMNDYISYIEEGFRNNKIKIPSSADFGGANKNKLYVESYFSSEHSKELYTEAYKAIKNFYDGTSYDGTTNKEGVEEYLDYLNAEVYISSLNKDVKITEFVDEKFSAIDEKSAELNTDLAMQIETDNNKMILAYGVIQDLVHLIKTNVLPALSVDVDYVDSDND